MRITGFKNAIIKWPQGLTDGPLQDKVIHAKALCRFYSVVKRECFSGSFTGTSCYGH